MIAYSYYAVTLDMLLSFKICYYEGNTKWIFMGGSWHDANDAPKEKQKAIFTESNFQLPFSGKLLLSLKL